MSLFRLSTEAKPQLSDRQLEVRRHRWTAAGALLLASAGLSYGVPKFIEHATAPLGADCADLGPVPVSPGETIGKIVRDSTTVDGRGPLGERRESIQLTVANNDGTGIDPGEPLRVFVCGAEKPDIETMEIQLTS